MTKPNEYQYALPLGYLLHKYRISEVLGSGGFSIVYAAVDIRTNMRVVIKEYLPTDQAKRLPDETVESVSDESSNTFRHGMKRFFDEAAALAKVQHPNIVRVTDFFRQNNTVYLVMEHHEGHDLRWYLKRHHGRLSEKFIATVFPQLLEGLRALHGRGLLHLDIKPANIFLVRPGGKPILLDFGAAQASFVDKKRTGPHTLTLGFAPIEQHRRGNLGPWTDLYAMGATLYACMSGKSPPPAPQRAEKDTYKPALRAFKQYYSQPLLEAVDWCLQLDQEQRPKKADDLLEVFKRLSAEPPHGAPGGLLYRLTQIVSWYKK